MSRNAWVLFTTCSFVATGIGPRREAGAFDPNPIISIIVEDPHGLAGPGSRARSTTTRVSRSGGPSMTRRQTRRLLW
jgi:hypothetical protein